MDERRNLINEMSEIKYSLINDDGKMLTFKKKFSIFWCIIWGILFYLIYHCVIKKKKFMSYK